MIVIEKYCTTKRWRGTGLTARRFRKCLVQENLNFYLSFRGLKARPLSSPLALRQKMNYLRFRKLFQEFSEKLEEQHTFYLDSMVGFSVLYDRIVEKQLNVKEFLGECELANDDFLDTCSTIYSQISKHDFKPMSLSPVLKQGKVKERNQENGKNSLILAANCIVALYSYWEEYLRIEIGIAKGVIPEGSTNNNATRKILNEHVKSDIWGDLRHLRNSIVHNNGIANSKINGCRIIKCFKHSDPIELDMKKMEVIFWLLADYRNELNRMSLPPRKGIRLPEAPKC